MAQNWQGSWGWKLGLVCSLVMGGAIIALGDCAKAQITPDTTLGSEKSAVTSTGSVDQINGGATRGANLFHSFQEFNVGNGRSAYFTNPAGIENILSRVTGANPSNILGMLGVSGGNANLFLINPNGIIFGPNSSLDIRGSFLASTASSLNFADGNQFSATNPEAPPLLTINVAPGLQFGRNQPRAIANAGNLAVGKNLTLSGGAVVSTGQLAAPAGQVVVTAVSGDVQVGKLTARSATLSANNNITTGDIDTSSLENGGDISLTSDSGAINTSAGTLNSIAYNNGNGGAVTLTAQNEITTGNILTFVGFEQFGNGGNISLTSAAGAIDTTAGSVDTGATYGDAGAVTLQALNDITTAEIRTSKLKTDREAGDGGNISLTSTAGAIDTTAGPGLFSYSENGNAGDVTLNTAGNITTGGEIRSDSVNGNGGAVTLTALNDVTIGAINASVGSGNAGSVSINSRGSITTGGNIQLSSANGNGGAVTLTALNDITTGNVSTITLKPDNTTTSGEIGNAGNISLTSIAGAIDTTAGSLDAGTTFHNGGDITLKAYDHITTANLLSYVVGDGSGNGGSISLTSTAGAIDTTAGPGLFSYSGNGNAGTVTLDATDSITTGDIQAYSSGNGSGGNINLISDASVSFANGLISSEIHGLGKGGDINITAESLSVTNGAVLSAKTIGQGQAGSLSITTSDFVKLIGTSADGQVRSRLTTETEGDGAAGNLTITTKRLIVQDGGLISAGAFGNSFVDPSSPPANIGPGGDLTITASDSVELTGETIGETLEATYQSRLTTQTQSDGAAGNLTITTGKLFLEDGAQISAGTFPRSRGPGGDLTVTASNSVKVTGASDAFSFYETEVRSRITNLTAGAGAAGDLTITTGKLIVQDGGLVSAGAVSRSSELGNLSLGQGGSLNITASDSIEVIGGLAEPVEADEGGLEDTLNRSSLTTLAEGAGGAGDLTITTNKLIVRDGGQVSSDTIFDSTGPAGNLTVTASDSVEVTGALAGGEQVSRITNQTAGTGAAAALKISTGKLIVQDEAQISADIFGDEAAGELTIDAEQLLVRDGAEVTVSGERSGDAGNLVVNARSIGLDNQAVIKAETASGNGGNITLGTSDSPLDLLLIRNSSQISTTAGTAQASGNGGNITIDTGSLVALENSDITANAFKGRGGEVRISAQGDFRSPDSQVTASSAQGPQFSGTVELNTPDVDPSSGLVALPEEVVDVSGLVSQRCPTGGSNTARGSSEFVVTGRGGLPPSPSDPPNSDTVLADWVTLSPGMEEKHSSRVPTPKLANSLPAPLVEAQGWVRNSKGQVVLTAQAPTATLHSPGLASAACPGS